MYYFENADNVTTNSVTITGTRSMVYNAVTKVAVTEKTPVIEPVTLQQAKDWCKIDVTDDDTLITALITSARLICEFASNISFIPKDIVATVINGLGNIQLPYGPVTNTPGVDLTQAFTDLTDVTYEAGYSTLPENLKTAMLAQIAYMYENRGDVRTGTTICDLTKSILKQVRNDW